MVKWIIAIDQSASQKTKSNQIGWCIAPDDEPTTKWKHGMFAPDPPHFKNTRDWLRHVVLELTENPNSSNICVAIETVYLGLNPRVFAGLLAAKEHLHAVASDLGCDYVEITPQASAYAICAARPPKGERKEFVTRMASSIMNVDLTEHEADAIAIALAAWNKIKTTVATRGQ